MLNKKEKESRKDSLEKTTFNEIIPLLTKALERLKVTLGEKKFEKRIRKAAKLLTGGIKPAVTKKPAAEKSTTKSRVKKSSPKKSTAIKAVIPVPSKKVIKAVVKK